MAVISTIRNRFILAEKRILWEITDRLPAAAPAFSWTTTLFRENPSPSQSAEYAWNEPVGRRWLGGARLGTLFGLGLVSLFARSLGSSELVCRCFRCYRSELPPQSLGGPRRMRALSSHPRPSTAEARTPFRLHVERQLLWVFRELATHERTSGCHVVGQTKLERKRNKRQDIRPEAGPQPTPSWHVSRRRKACLLLSVLVCSLCEILAA